MLRVGGDEPPSILSDTLPPPLADSLSPWVRASSQGRARSGSTPAGRMPTVQALLDAPDCNAWVGRHRRAGRPGVTPRTGRRRQRQLEAHFAPARATSHPPLRVRSPPQGCEVPRRAASTRSPRPAAGRLRGLAGVRGAAPTRSPERPAGVPGNPQSGPTLPTWPPVNEHAEPEPPHAEPEPPAVREPNIRAVPAWSRKGKGP